MENTGSKRPNGGNISDGQNEVSGSDTDGPERKRVAPQDVNETRPPINILERQYANLKGRYDDAQERWLRDTNHLNEKLKIVRDASQAAIDGMRKQFETNVEELVNARVKFDKYLNRNQELEDRIESLEAKIKELKGDN